MIQFKTERITKILQTVRFALIPNINLLTLSWITKCLLSRNMEYLTYLQNLMFVESLSNVVYNNINIFSFQVSFRKNMMGETINLGSSRTQGGKIV